MATREQLFTKAGIIKPGPDLDAITEQAYLLQEEKEREKQLAKPPGGRAFYASMFPGGVDELRCGRAALYSMLNIPDAEAIKPQGRAIIEMGKSAEKQIVWRWGKMGLLLGVKTPKRETDYMEQIGFSDPDTWLSGYADAIMDIRPRWNAVLPVDIKSKSHDKITAMQLGQLSYDSDHYRQVQAYLYLCRKFHTAMKWDKLGLEPARAGIIYYVSRENPRNTWTAFIPYDEEFVEAGLERLRAWRDNFLADELPPRPKEWKWTKPPCQWCQFKKSCKQDIREDVTRLSESNAIQLAKKINPNYDEQRVREEVSKRWHSTKIPH